MTIFEPTKLPGVVLIKPTIFEDTRGYFFESYNLTQLDDNIGTTRFVQDNESKSTYGILRGLHFQMPPFEQTKLVRVVQGSVLDVAVDIRPHSPQFGQHVAIELSETNKAQLFIPQGFAHGFIVLSETAIFQYKVDNFYSKEHERGFRYNDVDLAIDWQIPNADITVSPRDMELPAFKDLASTIP